ncbi:hypothetical protein LRP50_25180 [Enterovibrio sp. ZSDZ42]|uniref:Uncharacterized protein n=1 Tax=Enterovibrio gelatinilyticus TaxID=2899819 RepID=A0ABT5R827_9GAMM|nr:hypothetical protein [Enterovibrio sp. ZSDZ42]MDD1796413.1 hypothetical protein [Enterovibrio sp. ZSDZ42]
MKFIKQGSAIALGFVISACGGGGGSSDSGGTGAEGASLSNASSCYNPQRGQVGTTVTYDYAIRSVSTLPSEEEKSLDDAEWGYYGYHIINESIVSYSGNDGVIQSLSLYRYFDGDGNFTSQEEDGFYEYTQYDDDEKSKTHFGYKEEIGSSTYEEQYLPSGWKMSYDVDEGNEISLDSITARYFIDGVGQRDTTVDVATKFIGKESITLNGTVYKTCKFEEKTVTTAPDFTSEATYVSYVGEGNGITLMSTRFREWEDGETYRSVRQITSASINGEPI